MKRFFEIKNSGPPSYFQEHDLPFIIGSTNNAHINLPQCLEIAAYLGSTQGHLFIQPVEPTIVFHNNESIQESTWIKSGDFTQISSSKIHYNMSGDKVILNIQSSKDELMLKPPSDTSLQTNLKNKEPKILPRVNQSSQSMPSRQKKAFCIFLASLFICLLCFTTFLLTALPINITIEPEPDKISLPWLPPIVTFNNRSLALPGNYTLNAHKKGYHSLQEELLVAKNQGNNFVYSLKKLPGVIQFNIEPPENVQLFIDDTALGTTPLPNQQIMAGLRRLKLLHHRYKVFETNIEVKGSGIKQNFSFIMEPAWAEITLSSKPSAASILQDNKKLGITPLSLSLLEGQHTLIFSKKDYLNKEISFAVQAGRNQSLEPVKLTPIPATLSINSTPQGATIMINNQYKGVTPKILNIASMLKHNVTLSLAGHKNRETELQLSPGEDKTLSLAMTSEYSVVFITSSPSGAKLSIDGTDQKISAGRFRLTEGKHLVELSAPGYLTIKKEVSTSKGFTNQLNISLIPENGISKQSLANNNHRYKPPKGMILLEPATFKMGSSRKEHGHRANEYIRQVQITRTFYLAEKNVTNKEFRQFRPSHSSGNFQTHTLNSDNQPVVNISWEDAIRYLNWLSTQEGLEPFYLEINGKITTNSPLTNGYRLPTEAEWALASRMANREKPAKYPWPGSFPPQVIIGNFSDQTASVLLSITLKGYTDSFPVTAPVASFPKNQAGFYDFGGNTSEWCHDFYTPYTNFAGKTDTDPVGPKSGAHHVVRGSSWRDATITELRLSYRNYSRQGRDYISFRTARYAN